MSGEGVIPNDPEIPFGRWQTGRITRGATHPPARDVCLPCSHVLSVEDGGSAPLAPPPSFPTARDARLPQISNDFRGNVS